MLSKIIYIWAVLFAGTFGAITVMLAAPALWKAVEPLTLAVSATTNGLANQVMMGSVIAGVLITVYVALVWVIDWGSTGSNSSIIIGTSTMHSSMMSKRVERESRRAVSEYSSPVPLFINLEPTSSIKEPIKRIRK